MSAPAEVFGLKDWLMIAATLAGPIFAVQAQKWLERWREHDQAKRRLFETLMATRAERLSPEHVRALNRIDMVYSGVRLFLGKTFTWQTKEEKAVIDKWRDYLDLLGTRPPPTDQKFDDTFLELLQAMAKHLKYEFDIVLLRKGGYYPIGYGQIEDQNKTMRQAALDVLTGKQKLAVAIVDMPPPNDQIIESYVEFVEKMGGVIDGGRLRVQVSNAPPTQQISQVGGVPPGPPASPPPPAQP